MAEPITYNLADLFQAQFGVRPVIPFVLPTRAEVPANIDITGINVIKPTRHGVISHLGTPVMFPVWFKAGNYQKLGSKGEVKRVDITNDLLLPFSVMVDFEREKHAPESPAASGYGSIIETYAIGNWSVRIRGFIISDEPGKFDEKGIKDLLQFEELADVVGVTGHMFNILKIRNIFIRRISLPKIEGKPTIQPFMMECSSSEPVELTIGI